MSDESDSSSVRTPPKKKMYQQGYCQTWEQEELFKNWLTNSKKGKLYFYCKSCDFNGKGGKSEILRHASTQKHKKLVETSKNQQTLFSMPKVIGATSLENSVKKGELLLCSFAVEHNISFNAMTHLSKILSKIGTDSEILQKIKCAKTKAESVMKNVIGETEKLQLISYLKDNNFSLIVDGSTDRSYTKHMALVCRIVDDNFNSNDYFLTLIPLDIANSETLYNHIVNFFTKYSIDYKKMIIGYASDGANVMMGAQNSLATRFKNDIPNIFILKCICHSFHLSASYACTKLPHWVEETARDIYTFLNTSPKRLSAYAEFQSFLNIKPHKILQPCQTRWLSLLPVVNRLLEQYESLKLYFTGVDFEDNLEKASKILKKLNNPLFKLYLQFLQFILPLFNDLNREMQSEKPKIHILYERLESLYKLLLKNYIKPKYLEETSIENIQFKNPVNFLQNNSIYLGGKIHAYIDHCGISNSVKHEFINNCLLFYVEAASQIYKRFPLRKYKIVQKLKFLNPKEVFNGTINSITSIAYEFPNIIQDSSLNNLDSEFRLLQCESDLKNMALSKDINVNLFWKTVSEKKRGDGTFIFPTLSKFVKSLFCLPHSSANVERIFSTINLLKTKQRNRCNTETLEGLLHAKNSFKKSCCYDFKVTPDHLKLFNNSMYDLS